MLPAVCRVCIYVLTYIQFWPHRNHASTTKKIGYLHVLQFCLSKIFSSWFAFMATVIFVLALDSTCVSSLPRMTYFIDHSLFEKLPMFQMCLTESLFTPVFSINTQSIKYTYFSIAMRVYHRICSRS